MSYQFNLYLENWLGYQQNITFIINRSDNIIDKIWFLPINESAITVLS